MINKKLIYVLFWGIFISCATNNEKAGSKDISAQIIQEAEAIVEQIDLPSFPDKQINLVEFSGRTPNEEGSYDFRKDIQSAINQLNKEGGGTLHFPHTDKGNWVKQIETYRVRGPIHLKSNVQLAFDPNLRIYFEFHPASYMLEGGTVRRYEGTTMYSFSPLIYAFNAQNIAMVQLDGSGVPARIDGDGMRWQRWAVAQDGKRLDEGLRNSYIAIRDINNDDVPLKERVFDDVEKDVFRPQMIHFFMCNKVLIDGLQLENSPFWMVHPAFS
ncbi:MAG: hypothetical protein AAF789_14445, partial [Bacteroidota bacterium]